MAATVPLVVSIPVEVAVNNVVRVPFYNEALLWKLAGHLRSLTAGTLSVEVRKNSTLMQTLSWSSPGLVEYDIDDESFADGDILRFDVTRLGTLPVDCVITVWMTVP